MTGSGNFPPGRALRPEVRLNKEQEDAVNKQAGYYRDTDARMVGDHEFRSVVYMLMQLADRYGYTPGDLKQIAFRAALELEMRRPGTWVLTQGQLEEIERETKRHVNPEELARVIEFLKVPL